MRSARWVFCLATITGCGAAATPQPASAPSASSARELDGPAGVPGAEVHKRGGKKIIASVGTRGGTLELSNGARLFIPQGALSETVELTFGDGARTTAFSNHEYERPIGPIVQIAPEVQLNAPVEISVPLASLPEGFSDKDLAVGVEVTADKQRAVQGEGVATRWDYLGAQNKGGRATLSLNTLPGYRIQFIVSKNE